MSLCST